MCEITPNKLFEKLYAYYGPQHWWPGEGYEIIVGAILTQNTSWLNVERVLEHLRKNDLLKPDALVACSLDKLESLIRSSGFFRQKAQYLKILSEKMLQKPYLTREELLSIKGIGEETADTILLYYFKKAEFIIDAYTIRVSQRIGFSLSNNNTFWKKYYHSQLPLDVKLFNEFHALLVLHAKTFCTKKNPNCKGCFLKESCAFGRKISSYKH